MRGKKKKKDGKERAQGKLSVSWDCLLQKTGWQRKERGCLQSKAWTGVGRAVWVFALWIQSHDSPLCPACLAGPEFSPQPPSLSTPRCPLSLQPEHLLNPACFGFTAPPFAWSCGRAEDENERKQDKRQLKHWQGFIPVEEVCFSLCFGCIISPNIRPWWMMELILFH